MTNFLWAELGNNIHIYVGFRLDFFGVILAFVMISGAFFVILFVYVDL